MDVSLRTGSSLWVARSATASRPCEWFDELVFAMLAEEWPGSPAHRKQQPAA